ncbi:MAG TPA: hypothetical protein PLB89_11225, partial [Flavobacteriales bacterium]|nr:hypothetical protein [Flavobacteriales bacterium]
TVSEAGTYVLTVTGANGCSSTATALVALNDVNPEVTIIGGDLPCEGGSVILVGNSDIAGTFLWAGPNGFSSADQSPSVTQPGLYTLVVSIGNGCDGRDSFVVGREDCEDCEPLISNCPLDITVQCGDDYSPAVLGGMPVFRSGWDDSDQGDDKKKKCPALVNSGWTDEWLGGCPMVIRRTFYAVDENGTTETCIQMITIIDDVPPVFENVPADITVACDANIDDIELPAVWAFDECSKTVVPVVLKVTMVPGTCPSEYSLVYTWTATDHCNNEGTAQWTVLVTDNEAPVISCDLKDMEADCSYIPKAPECTATDNCDSDVKLIYTESKSDGDCETGYAIERTWTAIDACGNASAQHQTILVPGKKKVDYTDAMKIIVNAAPNPFRDQCTLTIVAKENGKAVVTITDMQGRRIADAYNGPVTAGEATHVSFKPVDNGSGTFLYHVTLNGEEAHGRMMYQP